MSMVTVKDSVAVNVHFNTIIKNCVAMKPILDLFTKRVITEKLLVLEGLLKPRSR